MEKRRRKSRKRGKEMKDKKEKEEKEVDHFLCIIKRQWYKEGLSILP